MRDRKACAGSCRGWTAERRRTSVRYRTSGCPRSGHPAPRGHHPPAGSVLRPPWRRLPLRLRLESSGARTRASQHDARRALLASDGALRHRALEPLAGARRAVPLLGVSNRGVRRQDRALPRSGGRKKKAAQLGCGLRRVLLGKKVPARQCAAAHVVRPAPPDGQRPSGIGVPGVERPSCAPEHEQR